MHDSGDGASCLRRIACRWPIIVRPKSTTSKKEIRHHEPTLVADEEAQKAGPTVLGG